MIARPTAVRRHQQSASQQLCAPRGLWSRWSSACTVPEGYAVPDAVSKRTTFPPASGARIVRSAPRLARSGAMSFRETTYQPAVDPRGCAHAVRAHDDARGHHGCVLRRGARISVATSPAARASCVFIAAFACLLGIPVRRRPLGAALGRPAVRLRRPHRPRSRTHHRLLRQVRIRRRVWQAGGSTALFIAGFGAAGYATRRDLSALARVCFFALIGLILFGIVLIFVQHPRRRPDLRDPRTRDLRRLHDVRLPAASQDE